MAKPAPKRARQGKREVEKITLVVTGSTPQLPVGLCESRFLYRKETAKFYNPKFQKLEFSYDLGLGKDSIHRDLAFDVAKLIGYTGPIKDSLVSDFIDGDHEGRVPIKSNTFLATVPNGDDRVLISKCWEDPSDFIPLDEIFGYIFAPNEPEYRDDWSDQEEDSDDDDNDDDEEGDD